MESRQPNSLPLNMKCWVSTVQTDVCEVWDTQKSARTKDLNGKEVIGKIWSFIIIQ